MRSGSSNGALHKSRGLGLGTAAGLALLLACQGETSVVLNITGTAADARTLKVQLIGAAGPIGSPYSFGDAGKPLTLPGTVVVKTKDGTGRLGAFVWAEDASGRAVGQGRSQACFAVSAHTENRYDLALAGVPATWSPANAKSCSCESTPDMCSPGGRPMGDGGVAGAGGTGSSLGGSAGTLGGSVGSGGKAGVAGTGGSAGGSTDGGTAGSAGSTVRTDGGTSSPSGSDAGPVVTGALWGFENIADGWFSATGTLEADTNQKVQGASSLLITPKMPGATVDITSRLFSSSEIGSAPTPTIAISVFLSMAASESYRPSVDGRLDCPGAADGVYLGQLDLFQLKAQAMTWLRAKFTMPLNPTQVQALSGNVPGCKFQLSINGLMGTVRLDGLAFDP